MKENIFVTICLLFLILISGLRSTFSFKPNNKLITSKYSSERATNETAGLIASKAYFLVDPSYFWSLDTKTQISTRAPPSEAEFLVVNAPSIGIERLIFIKDKKEDGSTVYSHRAFTYLTYAFICTSIGRTQGWVLRQPASDIAFGFTLNNENEISSNCQGISPPYQVKKWFNSLNQEIKDMLVSYIWIS
ncbi:hypothetical protein HWI79_1562 [Cryptosporidium felis]|nr:hypothetical protein HWI79_1562 [Cryptosporidium felis]